MDHQDWCSHRGYVCVWYLQQRGLDPCRAADSIEAPSCVMAVSFHPVEPAHLVAGTFSGERSSSPWSPCSLVCLVAAFVQYAHITVHLDSMNVCNSTQ